MSRIYSQFIYPAYQSVDDEIIDKKLKEKLASEMLNELE